MKFIRACKFALEGIYFCLKHELNYRIQFAVLCLAIILGWTLKISPTEWLFLIGISAAVISLEMINTALEQLCDGFCDKPDPRIKIIKDVAAGAVWINALASMVIGSVIFIPKLLQLLHQ